jgi:hypothetical protein
MDQLIDSFMYQSVHSLTSESFNQSLTRHTHTHSSHSNSNIQLTIHVCSTTNSNQIKSKQGATIAYSYSANLGDSTTSSAIDRVNVERELVSCVGVCGCGCILHTGRVFDVCVRVCVDDADM